MRKRLVKKRARAMMATEELAHLRKENAQLRKENAQLKARLQELEMRLGQNSQNSSKPPPVIRPRLHHVHRKLEQEESPELSLGIPDISGSSCPPNRSTRPSP